MANRTGSIIRKFPSDSLDISEELPVKHGPEKGFQLGRNLEIPYELPLRVTRTGKIKG